MKNPFKNPSLALASPLQALSWGYVLVAVAWVSFTLYTISQWAWTSLTKDQWRYYGSYFSIDFPENVLSLQGTHPNVFPALIRLLDIHLTDASNVLIITFGLVLVIAMVCLMSWIILKDQDLSMPVKWVCVSLCWLLIFWMGNIRNLGHDPILPYSLVALPFNVAILFLIRAHEASKQGLSGRKAKALLVTSLACFIAMFTQGAGINTWLAIIFIAVVLRLSLKKIGFFVALLVGCYLLYAFALPGRGVGSAINLHPVDGLVNVSMWLGSPIFNMFFRMVDMSRGLAISSLVLGGVALLTVSVIFLKKLFKPGSTSPLEIWCLAIIAFGIGIGFETALVRGSSFAETPGQGMMAPRYLQWASLFWLGLLILLGLYAWRQPRRLFRGAWLAVVCLLPLLLLPSHIQSSRNHRFAKIQQEKAGLGLVVGVQDDVYVTRFLHRSTLLVYRVAETLKSRNLAMFSWDIATYIDKQVDDVLHVVPSDAIKAGVLPLDTFPDRDQVGARFRGWAVDTRTGRPPKYIVAANAGGKIQGLALFMSEQRNIAKRFNLDPDTELAFNGYIKNFTARTNLTFYAVLEDGRSAVRLQVR